ncbi:uncharacterized protein [Epargyreus clarus]|uniref:uncharacterized protein n=1 Tax=Epargyreus clarus TaxID=520877 RepID=UPI003C2CF43D
MAVKISIILAIGVLTTARDVFAAVDCKQTGAGRFPVPEDTTCQRYTLCVYDSTNKSYLAYNYVCPTTSVFNPNTSKCTASGNYQCKVTIVCTADGYVANPKSTDCTSYIECVKINGIFIETIYTCPDTTFFNPSTSFCEYDYTCTTKKEFKCSAPGRFADTSDNTCKNYYFCVLANGLYTQYKYTCPSDSVFNPTSKVCTSSYKCNSK